MPASSVTHLYKWQVGDRERRRAPERERPPARDVEVHIGERQAAVEGVPAGLIDAGGRHMRR